MKATSIALAAVLAATPASAQRAPATQAAVRSAEAAAWVGAGLLAAGLAMSGSALLVRNVAAADWNSDACAPPWATRAETCPGARSAARSAEPVIVMGVGVGAVGAVMLTAALIWRAGSPGGVRVASGPGDVGGSLEVTF